MATVKKSAKKTVKQAAKTAKIAEVKTTSTLRKGARAYLGLYAVAYERAAMRAEQVKGFYAKTTDGLVEDLVARGEKVEEMALDTAKVAQKRAVETFETTTGKVKAVLPIGANDRVEELQAEVKALNKKITALSKKNATKKAGINKQVMATEKTAKKAA